MLPNALAQPITLIIAALATAAFAWFVLSAFRRAYGVYDPADDIYNLPNGKAALFALIVLAVFFLLVHLFLYLSDTFLSQ